MQDHESVKIQVEPSSSNFHYPSVRIHVGICHFVDAIVAHIRNDHVVHFDPMNAWAVPIFFSMAMSLVSLFLICPLSCYHQKYPINLVLLVAFICTIVCCGIDLCITTPLLEWGFPSCRHVSRRRFSRTEPLHSPFETRFWILENGWDRGY